jgi:hypothetical protein
VTDPNQPNKHILEYLNYYCDPASDFDYAVLLTGPWGVGKTHFIKQFIESRTVALGDDRKTKKTLFVSLYGITSFRQIEDEFQRQLHPILSSKGMKIAWAVGKGLLKSTTKIDLGDKEELSINAQIPEIDFADYFQTPKDCILIFDDLERCSMNASDILGYINSFVEHHSFKTIILANETAILEKDEKYKLIKEKLIGQTLELQPSTQAALSNFLKGIRHQKTLSFLESNADLLLSIYRQSGTNNLRLLKHSLWDFERLATTFTEKHWSNDEALTSLLRIVLSLSFEVRSGALRVDELGDLGISEIIRHMEAKGKEDASVAGRIERKYEPLRLQDTPLSFQLLKALLGEGVADPDLVREALDASRYYSDPALEPAWLTAWRGWEFSDDRFETAAGKVESQFNGRSFQNSEELLHIFGLRLFFSEIGVIAAAKDTVVKQCIDCLDDLAKQNKIEEFDTSKIWRAGGVYCLGHGVTQSETPEFQTIYDAFERKVSEAKAAHLPRRAKELFSKLKDDPVGWARQLMLNNVSSSEFYNVPILAVIKPADFVDVVLALEPAAQSTAFSTLRGRYELGLLAKELADEKPWLESVRSELTIRMPALAPMSRFRLTNLAKRNVDPFLHKDYDK